MYEDRERLFDRFFTRGRMRPWRWEWPARGEFLRTIALPAAMDSYKAKANFNDGMLELVIPKTEARKRRTVPSSNHAL